MLVKEERGRKGEDRLSGEETFLYGKETRNFGISRATVGKTLLCSRPFKSKTANVSSGLELFLNKV